MKEIKILCTVAIMALTLSSCSDKGYGCYTSSINNKEVEKPLKSEYINYEVKYQEEVICKP